MRKLRTVFHVGLDTYPPLSETFATKDILLELAKVADRYVVFSRAQNHWPAIHHLNNLTALWLPKLLQPFFAFTSLVAVPLAVLWRPQVIIVQEPIIGGTIARLCRAVSGARILMEVHTELYPQWAVSTSWYRRLLAAIAFRNYRHADTVRILHPWFAPGLIQHGVSPDRLRVLPTRVDCTVFNSRLRTRRTKLRRDLQLPDRAPVITTVGRLAPEKNIPMLLDAFRTLQATNPEAVLMIVGDGPLRSTLELAAQSMPNVRFTGALAPAAVANVLAASDIYVQSSQTEALPRATLEAMAMGLPAIATAVGAIPAIFNEHRCGILVPSGDARALAAHLKTLSVDSRARAELGRAAQAVILHMYEWRANFEQYRALITDVAATR